jgi:hypothetical protein
MTPEGLGGATRSQGGGNRDRQPLGGGGQAQPTATDAEAAFPLFGSGMSGCIFV